MKSYPTVLLMSISLFAISARADESKIEGVVLGANDRPLTNTAVQIVNESSPQHPTKVKTDEHGLFIAPGLTPGSYTVEVFVNSETRWLRHQVTVARDKTTHLAITSKSLANAPRRVVWVDRSNQGMEKIYTVSQKEWEDLFRRLGLGVQ